jgi:hypothetical protein
MKDTKEIAMPMSPPPAPLTPKEFKRRWKAGARTMAELDPDHHDWFRKQMESRWRMGVVISSGLIGLLALSVLLSIQ